MRRIWDRIIAQHQDILFSSRHPGFIRRSFSGVERSVLFYPWKGFWNTNTVISSFHLGMAQGNSAEKVFLREHPFLFSVILQEAQKEFFGCNRKEQESGSSERADKFVPLSSKENTAEEQGGAPQEKWRSHIQETGGAGIARPRESVELWSRVCKCVVVLFTSLSVI